VDSYPEPVDKLLTLGELKFGNRWQDYPSLGLSSEHIPDLIRMATDSALNQAASDSKEVWAPAHAWRTLGQLHATAAAEPLLGMLDEADRHQDDWALEDMPEVFALLGPCILPALAAYLAEPTHRTYARLAAIRGLAEMSKKFAETRAPALAVLSRQLEAAAGQSPELNAFLVDGLLDLKAVEAAATIESAYAAGLVDEMVCGGWEEVRYELGLGEKPEEDFDPDFDEAPRTYLAPAPWVPEFFLERPPRDHQAKDKAKARRKMAAKSRKRNRAKKRK
jgi:hypothetical protein